MPNLAAGVMSALTSAGVEVVSVSIGHAGDRATWKVLPASLQSAAQPIIDAFNPNDPQLATDEIDRETDVKLRGVIDHVITAVSDELAKAGVSIGAPRLFAERVRSRVIELSRSPIIRPKKGG